MAKKVVEKKTPEKKNKVLKTYRPINGETHTNDTDDNPLLTIRDNPNFTIELGNFLDNPCVMIKEGYESFDPSLPNQIIEDERFTWDAEVMVMLRYFEYIIQARFPMTYIKDMWLEGERTKDITFAEIIQGIEHRLTVELQLKVPTFDTINTIDIRYYYKIKYVQI